MQRGSSNAGSSRSSRPSSSRRSSVSASSSANNSAVNTERSSNKNGAKQVNIGFGKLFISFKRFMRKKLRNFTFRLASIWIWYT